MGIIDQIAATLTGEVGYRETPVNITRYAAVLDAAEHHSLGRQGSPWCGTFIDWGFRHENALDALPTNNFWTPGAARKYFALGRFYKTPQRGDLACLHKDLDHGHVGFVLDVLPGGRVRTVEGNTTTSASGSQANGGEVAIKERSIGWWEGYGRPFYDHVEVRPDPAPIGGTDMIEFLQLDDTHPPAEHDPVWVANLVTQSWVPSQEDLAIKLFALGWPADYKPRQLGSKEDLFRWGVPVGPMPPGWVA